MHRGFNACMIPVSVRLCPPSVLVSSLRMILGIGVFVGVNPRVQKLRVYVQNVRVVLIS